MFRHFSRFLLNLCFPRQCLGCGMSDTWICQPCWNTIKPLSIQVCYICREPSPQGQTCPHHQSPLRSLLVCAHHDGNPLLKKLLHELKYQHRPEGIGDRLASLVSFTFEHYQINPQQVIPVPLHPKRLRERGFNQAELLCQDFPNTRERLIRQRHTDSQVRSKSRQARLLNLKDAFACTKKLDPDIHYWIVDDVATTGSTLEECAKTLHRAGARTVSAIVVSRNSFQD